MNYNKKIQLKLAGYILTLIIVFLFFPLLFIQATTSRDAIAMRVVPNSGHLPPSRWYQDNVKLKGAPQSLAVDGYEAVRDGRTVYVNAANIIGNDFYTNIYIISYNQDAEASTIDIFGQILVHWTFNINITDKKVKAAVTRDTKRLADLYGIKLALEAYKARGFYPKLSAGTYLAGKTISVWPSWQETLGKELKAGLPLDPVNQLGPCGAGYDKTTCWDQGKKSFDGAIPGGLPSGSKVYVYLASGNGDSYRLCANWESKFTINPAPDSCTR